MTVVVRRRRIISNVYLHQVEGIESRVGINAMWIQYGGEMIITVDYFDTMRHAMCDLVKMMRGMET